VPLTRLEYWIPASPLHSLVRSTFSGSCTASLHSTKLVHYVPFLRGLPEALHGNPRVGTINSIYLNKQNVLHLYISLGNRRLYIAQCPHLERCVEIVLGFRLCCSSFEHLRLVWIQPVNALENEQAITIGSLLVNSQKAYNCLQCCRNRVKFWFC